MRRHIDRCTEAEWENVRKRVAEAAEQSDKFSQWMSAWDMEQVLLRIEALERAVDEGEVPRVFDTNSVDPEHPIGHFGFPYALLTGNGVAMAYFRNREHAERTLQLLKKELR